MTIMARNGDITTTTLNRRGKFFQLEDGTILDITAMLDGRGNVTEPDAAIIGVYQLPDGYRAVDLRMFEDENGSKSVSPARAPITCVSVNKRDRYFRLESGNRMDIAIM